MAKTKNSVDVPKMAAALQTTESQIYYVLGLTPPPPPPRVVNNWWSAMARVREVKTASEKAAAIEGAMAYIGDFTHALELLDQTPGQCHRVQKLLQAKLEALMLPVLPTIARVYDADRLYKHCQNPKIGQPIKTAAKRMRRAVVRGILEGGSDLAAINDCLELLNGDEPDLIRRLNDQALRLVKAALNEQTKPEEMLEWFCSRFIYRQCPSNRQYLRIDRRPIEQLTHRKLRQIFRQRLVLAVTDPTKLLEVRDGLLECGYHNGKGFTNPCQDMVNPVENKAWAKIKKQADSQDREQVIRICQFLQLKGFRQPVLAKKANKLKVRLFRRLAKHFPAKTT